MAPLVFLCAVVSDIYIAGVHHSLGLTLAAEMAATLSYLVFAGVMRHGIGFDAKAIRLSQVVNLLAVVPAGALAVALVYCGALYAGGALPANMAVTAIRQFWVGDAVGILITVPMASAAFHFAALPRWTWSRHLGVTLAVFILGTALAFVALHGYVDNRERHHFYLFFLPVVWVGMRAGYPGVAVALFAIQLCLAAFTPVIGPAADDFGDYQLLMLVLSATGLLLGATISERQQGANLMREQQAELARVSAYAAAGAMGMTLAHEISQPLSAVASYLHAARRMLQANGPTGPAVQALEMAEAEARRTTQTLERIRDFVSVGRMQIEAVEVFALLERIAALSRDDADARGVRVDVAASPAKPTVRADRVQMQQALNNLVANAIDAAALRRDSRGVVSLRVAEGGGRVAIFVEDNGTGVASEISDRLFEAYQTTKPRGMGLGLPLSLQIVQEHGGRLRWEPIAPEGTRFVVELVKEGPGRDGG